MATDEHLRSALEFTVGLAAIGAKVRPPLAHPAGLKPFLKFNRLPAVALAQVRVAVENDPEFRRRLGIGASAELVDELGMLWLRRPQGWETAIEELAAEPAGEADQAGELRRERRRRESAESAALRTRAELVTMQVQLDSALTAQRSAEESLAQATVDLAAARQQVQQLERALKKRAAGVDAATERVGSTESELAETREALAAAVEARDAALADRADENTTVDIERVRQLLTEALAATRGAVSPGRRRRRRSPIAVPGGVYGNSEAAAEHILRTADVVVLVDGYNVAKLGWPSLALDQQRARCIEAAENLARRWGTYLHLVFDGASVVGAVAPGRRLVRVSFSPEGVIADDVLRAEVAALGPERPVVVVTNDQAIVTDVRADGANVISSDVFLAVARR